MQSRSYQTTSLDEGSSILNSEWSRHHLGVGAGETLRLRFSIRSISDAITLSSLAYGTRVLIRPEDRADVLLFNMPRAGTGFASHRLRNTPLDTSHYGLIEVKQVALMQCSGDFDALVLRIQKSRIKAYLESTLGRTPERELMFEPGISAGTPAWHAWTPITAALEQIARHPDCEYPPAALAALETMILSSLVMTQPHNFRDALQRPGATIAPGHVRKAEEFIRANLSRVVSTEEMAAHVGVSIRALFDGFRNFKGMTPAVYARDARLACARDDLQRGDENVAAVAARWGFQHSGHFAAHYRRKFGETPANTRRHRSGHFQP